MRQSISLAAIVVASAVATASTCHASGTPAMATFEFFQSDTLEATIGLVSTLPGEEGNGIAIEIWEVAGTGSVPFVTGNAAFGYKVGVDDAMSTTYSAIAQFLTRIPAVTASLDLLVEDSVYEGVLQAAPPGVVLTGGVDAHVPEPNTLGLAAAIAAAIGCRRRRRMKNGSPRSN